MYDYVRSAQLYPLYYIFALSLRDVQINEGREDYNLDTKSSYFRQNRIKDFALFVLLTF